MQYQLCKLSHPGRMHEPLQTAWFSPMAKLWLQEGQPYAVPFTDTNATLTPELWDLTTQTFTILPPHAKSGTYHSIALMLDGGVFTGGGGLCESSCTTNHEDAQKDAQIYSPSYLFNADGSLATRPVIISLTSIVDVGKPITVVTDTIVTNFSITRYESNTHTVNTDQRRIVLTPTFTNGTTSLFTIPADPGIALPGFWMFWAMNSAGVPGLGGTVQITL